MLRQNASKGIRRNIVPRTPPLCLRPLLYKFIYGRGVANPAPFAARLSMTLRPVSLDDKYDLGQSRVLVTGYQALIRACLMQKARDRAAGLKTAGYLTGYRGSPLGGLDQQFMPAAKPLTAAALKFQAG